MSDEKRPNILVVWGDDIGLRAEDPTIAELLCRQSGPEPAEGRLFLDPAHEGART